MLPNNDDIDSSLTYAQKKTIDSKRMRLPTVCNNMNVLLLTQFFSTTRGGGEYVFSMIAQLLAEKGNNV